MSLNRAVIIVTDAGRIAYQGLHFTGFGEHTTPWCEVEPSEQLLADLNKVLGFAVDAGITLEPSFAEAVERVRAAIGDTA